MVNFTAKIWKSGHSWVITIPADFVTHKLLTTDKEYTITIKVKP